MRILLIHGRSQGGKDKDLLKRTWVETLDAGLQAAGAALPQDVAFDFPYYGDKLDELTAAADLPTPDEVVAKGPGQNRKFELFMQQALDEIYTDSDLTEAEVEAQMDPDGPREKGPQNWRWVQAIARAIDKRFTGQASWTIEKFLRDVYLYVNIPRVTKEVNAIVEELLTDEPTVVVGHSLGTVVGYKVIADNLPRLHLCKYVTVGSPLGMRAISAKLGVPKNLAAQGWYNAYDRRDIVALNPLDGTHFPADPAIVNNDSVRNQTDNRHGIIGYLNDANVARIIAEAAKQCAE